MLSARAYSFRQKSKLAISLSWVGGYVNVVIFLLCSEMIANMTGNVTQFAGAIARGDSRLIGTFGLLIVSFWLGAVASALMTESAQRRGVRSKYILPMASEALLLGALALLLMRHSNAVAGMGLIAAFTMGLQNATITEISGAVIRTTHLTGVVTDFGLEGVRFLNWYIDRTRGRRWSRSGRVLRISQRHPTAQRLLLLFSLFWGFILGGAMGGWAFLHYPALAMLPPVTFLIWIIVMDWLHPIASVRELDLLSDPELKAHGIVKSLLPPELGLYRLMHHRDDRAHRPPDFQQWLQHVPGHWRAIILAVSPLTWFNENSALALCDVVRQLKAAGRELIISGVTPTQYRILVAGGLLDVTDSENVCPDLEFAIARGMAILHSTPHANIGLNTSP